MSKIYFHIDKEDTVESIQQKFSNAYPFLRIVFFKDKPGKEPDACFCHDVKMKEIKPHFKPGDLDISDTMTVDELEHNIYNQFDLLAQVSRRSGNLWLETTMTDHWTLKEQNDHGREISSDHEYFRDIPYPC